MEITHQQLDDYLEVKPVGRLDSYWADHLTQALEEVLRQGHDRIRLNMSGVDYISSIGIRVLVTFRKKLAAISGTFIVTEPSEQVSKVLDMVGLRAVLMPAAPARPAATAAATAAAPAPAKSQPIETTSATVEVHSLSPNASMSCTLIGDSALLDTASYTAVNCRPVRFPATTIGFGLGAFGENFDACKSRFGEFLAVSGAAIYQPADGSNAPDSQVAQGTFVPELQVLYAASVTGSFRALGRFEPKEKGVPTGMSELAEAALRIANADTACIAVIAESAGLIGASLRRPPVSSAGSPFDFPEIRKWLSFTTEPVHTRALTLVTGIVSRKPGSHLLRPAGTGLHAHLHAAAFTYRPLQRGALDLNNTVHALFENEALLGVLHLINDDRPGSLGESKFYRGALWAAPLTTMEPAK